MDKVCDAAKSGTWLDVRRTWLQRDAGEHSTSEWSYQYPGHGPGWLGSDYSYYNNHHEFDGFYCTGKENINSQNISYRMHLIVQTFVELNIQHGYFR